MGVSEQLEGVRKLRDKASEIQSLKSQIVRKGEDRPAMTIAVLRDLQQVANGLLADIGISDVRVLQQHGWPVLELSQIGSLLHCVTVVEEAMAVARRWTMSGGEPPVQQLEDLLRAWQRLEDQDADCSESDLQIVSGNAQRKGAVSGLCEALVDGCEDLMDPMHPPLGAHEVQRRYCNLLRETWAIHSMSSLSVTPPEDDIVERILRTLPTPDPAPRPSIRQGLLVAEHMPAAGSGIGQPVASTGSSALGGLAAVESDEIEIRPRVAMLPGADFDVPAPALSAISPLPTPRVDPPLQANSPEPLSTGDVRSSEGSRPSAAMQALLQEIPSLRALGVGADGVARRPESPSFSPESRARAGASGSPAPGSLGASPECNLDMSRPAVQQFSSLDTSQAAVSVAGSPGPPANGSLDQSSSAVGVSGLRGGSSGMLAGGAFSDRPVSQMSAGLDHTAAFGLSAPLDPGLPPRQESEQSGDVAGPACADELLSRCLSSELVARMQSGCVRADDLAALREAEVLFAGALQSVQQAKDTIASDLFHQVYGRHL